MELMVSAPSLSSPASSIDANATGGNGTGVTPVPPVAYVIPTGIGLYVLSLATLVGNAMVLHAIRTEKRLQTVRHKLLKMYFVVVYYAKFGPNKFLPAYLMQYI